jgi:hypothetical protein
LTEGSTDQSLVPGVGVEVRNRFSDSWSRGFEIAAIEEQLYRLRRRSDGEVLPRLFSGADLRRQHEGTDRGHDSVD